MSYVNKETANIIIANRDLAPVQDIACYPARLPDGRYLRVNYYSFCKHIKFTGHKKLTPDNNDNHANFRVVHGISCGNKQCIIDYYNFLHN